jgi:MoaA/NifB/PqqE/SkfB family radical SAM enzyme
MQSTSGGLVDGVKLVASTRPQNKFYINWWLMNHCSWACSYCHDIIRKGNIDLPYLNDCKQFVTDAVFFAANQNKTPRIEFTGGEVTEWTDFLELLSYAHTQGCETHFRTNANLGLNRWQEYLAVVDDILIEYHPEHTSPAHFLLAVNAAVDAGISVTVNLNMLKDTWEDSQAVYDKIQLKWPQIRLNRRMLFDDPVFNTSPQEYTQEQIVQLKKQHGDIKITTGANVEYTDYQTLVLECRNKFKGYECWAGIEQVVVDAWGRVYRGHCRQGGFMGNIKDKNIVWPTQPKPCTLDACRNSFDILATKSI